MDILRNDPQVLHSSNHVSLLFSVKTIEEKFMGSSLI